MFISSVIIILTLVHPFATSWPSSPKGDARTLRDLPFCIIWHEKHYGNQPPPVAFPPLVPYGTTHQRGMHFLARRAVVKVLYKLAPSINLEAPFTTLSGVAAVKLKNPRGHSPVKL